MSENRRLLMVNMAKRQKIIENRGNVINFQDQNFKTQVAVDLSPRSGFERSVMSPLSDNMQMHCEQSLPLSPKQYTELQPVIPKPNILPELNKDDLAELNEDVPFSDLSISLHTTNFPSFDTNILMPSEISFVNTPEQTFFQEPFILRNASTPLQTCNNNSDQPCHSQDHSNDAQNPNLSPQINQVTNSEHVTNNSFEKSTEELIQQLSNENFSKSHDDLPSNKKNTAKKRERDPTKRLEVEKKIYTLKPPCRKECRKRCYEKFSEQEREEIWSNFRGLDKQEQRNFISRHVKRSKKSIITKQNSRRNNTLTWTLRDTIVCKTFFLGTLGFKNDQTVVTVLKANCKHRIKNVHEVPAAPEQRGRARPWNSFPDHYKQDIIEYIEKIRPTVSHYNLAHAPNRRYLPCGVSFMDLYRSYIAFCDETQTRKCSWAYFHGIIKQMNLSTSLPKQDICTLCQNHKEKHSEEEHHCDHCDCQFCNIYPTHLKNRNLSRQCLEADVNDADITKKVFTADMQKAICMPKLETKDYYFSRKLVLFNETFVSPGKNEPAFCMVWHEGESGRKAYNIASSYVHFIVNYAKDIQEIIIYCDNCTAQNKNRILFTAMIRLINSKELITAKKIRFVYLEPGHTYMAADAVHACITNKFTKQKNMYDLMDYVNTMRASRKNMVIEIMKHDDMIVFSDQLKKNAFPKNYNIQSLKVVEFRRDSTRMFVKNAYDEDDFKELDVFRKNILNMDQSEFLNEVPREAKMRGVSKEKKEDLLKLCDSLPIAFRKFFEDLGEGDVLDLDGELDI